MQGSEATGNILGCQASFSQSPPSSHNVNTTGKSQKTQANTGWGAGGPLGETLIPRLHAVLSRRPGTLS